jgi:hypothetical protein
MPMAYNDKDLEKVERVLAETHRTRHVPLLGPAWTQRVMRDIRSGAIREGNGNAGRGVEQLVWRTAAVAAAVAVVLTASIVAVSWTGSSESAGLLAEEFESVSLLPE